MEKKVFNGMYSINGITKYSNAHLSYKGKSVIIDYELCLHSYPKGIDISKVVPVEVYPYNEDVTWKLIEVDKRFRKVKLDKLTAWLDKIISEEYVKIRK